MKMQPPQMDFVPMSEICFSNGKHIFLYLSIDIKTNIKVDEKIVEVIRKQTVLQGISHTNKYGYLISIT
jgi:hypothetical protein